jgi:glycoprotein-N-acetylgalactosamine 3-beta-galactosyltransferase
MGLYSYVVLENLRYFLSPYNTSKPLWFGHKYKTDVKAGYFSGGAGIVYQINQYYYRGWMIFFEIEFISSGYVLSKEATKRFVTEG